jgi:hypothetical protein
MEIIRKPLERFQHRKGKIEPVYHALLTDDTLGIKILAGLLDNSSKLENSRMTYEKPETSKKGLVGVTFTHFDPVLDVIFLGILTVNLAFHSISNDAFAARDLMVKTVFGTRETFNRQAENLSISQEWTDAPEFVQPFNFAVNDLMPFSEGPHYFQD